MSWTGKSPNRKEDDRLIRGQGLFVDDKQDCGMLHLHLVRSPYAHARILNIDVSAAEALPGVICTLTGAQIKELMAESFMELAPEPAVNIQDYPMAVDKAVFQGEPVAAVVAETPALAADGGELIEIDYDMLDAVVTAEQALED